MEQTRRRKPAQDRWINELSDQDLQKRVKVLGSILDIKSTQDEEQDQIHAILDDGTKQIQVNIKTSISLEPGNQVRVFGILGKNEKDEYIIDAEIVQDMSTLDIELYKRVQEVKNRFKNSLNVH